MKPTKTLLALRVKPIIPERPNYKLQEITSISHVDLPNNGFGIKNYYIPKTKFNHLPIYKKVQNTKVTTEIKRIQGDIHQLKQDILNEFPSLKITMNQSAGIINVKGDLTKELTKFFTKEIR
ncbi:IMG2 [Candida pseudojiufengensis]|uniref:IMG2 n=1 Tax=Candida pseudojiufengensis TaxID=497109 RepID=UPI002224D0DB|nr:IMG2 [Candida pseudojiufengensis]KAI5959411.1 IMG2 [Candida pseudojiufengensis]